MAICRYDRWEDVRDRWRILGEDVPIGARKVQDTKVLLEHMSDSTIFPLPTSRVPCAGVDRAQIVLRALQHEFEGLLPSRPLFVDNAAGDGIQRFHEARVI